AHDVKQALNRRQPKKKMTRSTDEVSNPSYHDAFHRSMMAGQGHTQPGTSKIIVPRCCSS
ncbi:hypothetical protein A2U01_0054703, partial [Trifolium medium]|nr:hypothetical protein [Trifolium medium]